jgi:nucleoside-diphosphate-sugar epimerase
MNVLVTGGCGYLGTALVDALHLEGHNVTVLDNLTFGNNGIVECLIEGDITEEKILLKSIMNKDVVIHLAAIVGEPAGNIDKELTLKVNYMATRNLARLCEDNKIKLIFSSTASVYGAHPTQLLNENSDTCPLSIYAMTKLAAEDSIKNICSNYIIFRLGTLFGLSRRMRFDLAVNRFIAMATLNEPIPVFGGSQYRPFLHLKDAVKAFLKAIESDKIGLFNLGGYNYQIVDVANMIANRLNATLKIYPELKDKRNYRVDSSLAIKTFNIRFENTIEQAIEEIASYLKFKPNYRDPIFNNESWLRQKCRL